MSDAPAPLPEPDSDQLTGLIGSTTLRLLYGFLYRRRDNPPTMVELWFFATNVLGEDRSQTGRRLRELGAYFDLPAEVINGSTRYVLRGWASGHSADAGAAISLRVRAQVLASQRCAQCGRTPTDDHVRLVVDHKIPRTWGGTNDRENLQPLCEDCNVGKRDYFRSFEDDADKIRKAIAFDEPQKRIGELLRAFDRDWVRTDLLAMVASAKEYQEDWQRRLRDLRFLGWDYEHQKRYTEGARVWTYYRVTKSAPWPDNIRGAITAEEERRRRAKQARSNGP